MSLALAAPRAVDRGERLAGLLDAQQRVLSLIARNAPLEDTLNAIAVFAEAWIPGMKGSILCYDAAAGQLRRGGYASLPASFADTVDGLVPGPAMGSCGTCAYRQQRVISEDVFTDPLWDGFHDLCRQYAIRSAWSSPLIASSDQSLLGVFGMYHPEIRRMSADDEALVDHFAHLAALAIERHRDQARQHHLATHDALTGLGNRRLLAESGEARLFESQATGLPLSVVFIDLDNFKSANDTFGHVLGDRVLREVAVQMRDVFGVAAPLVRFGGDEFVVVLQESAASAMNRIEALRATLSRSIRIDALNMDVRFSAGLVEAGKLAPLSAFEDLVLQADEMSRRAKLDGGDRCAVADAATTERWSLRHRIARGLVEALETPGTIAPHLQPVVTLPRGEVHGYELLLRFGSGPLTGLPVSEVIDVAEQSGLIIELGNRILDFAYSLLADYPTALSGKQLNVNVSVRQLASREFMDRIRSLAHNHPQLTRQVCLEITESHWLDTNGPAAAVLDELKQLGLRLALDDFGTGHASLSYLQALPFDVVKIDRHFVTNVDSDLRNRSICMALLAMARSCSMQVVAEGVETQAEADTLTAIGFDQAQGYLWSRPVPVARALGH